MNIRRVCDELFLPSNVMFVSCFLTKVKIHCGLQPRIAANANALRISLLSLLFFSQTTEDG